MNEKDIKQLIDALINLQQRIAHDIDKYETEFSNAPQKERFIEMFNSEIDELEILKEKLMIARPTERRKVLGKIEKCEPKIRDIVNAMLKQPQNYPYDDIRKYLCTQGIEISLMAVCNYNKRK